MPRYIDADKLMETIKAHDYLLVAHNNSIDRGMFTAGIQQVIDESPAADVEPVKRGEWIEVSTIPLCLDTEVEEKCSLCGRYVYRYDTVPQDSYCPNCSADMRDSQ